MLFGLFRALCVLIVAASLGGCAPLLAGGAPVHLAKQSSVKAGNTDKAKSWAMRAASTEKSPISNKPRFVVEAQVVKYTKQRVVVDVWLSSTNQMWLNPRGFYIYWHADGKMVEVGSVDPGPMKNTPYKYTYQVVEREQIGEIEHADGTVDKINRFKEKTYSGSEDYWRRKTRLVFSGGKIGGKGRKNHTLEIRDAGLNAQLSWKVKPGGGDKKPPPKKPPTKTKEKSGSKR